MEKVKIGNFVVWLEDNLMGSKFWSQSYRHSIPRFEVYQYIGKDIHRNLFFFQSKRNTSIIWKTQVELDDPETHLFKPFLINTQPKIVWKGMD